MAVGNRELWNDKWAEAGRGTSHGSALVDLVRPWLSPSGSLLDIAGGGSSDSLHFARLGLDVTVADVSDETIQRYFASLGPRELQLPTQVGFASVQSKM